MADSPLKGLRILVVDDDSDMRDVLVFELKRRGAVVTEACCGNEAIEAVKKNNIQIVVSDVRMPNGTGIDLLTALRKDNSEVPIVLLATGFADLTESEALKMGAQALLEKPIDRKLMIKILEDSICPKLACA